MSSHEAKDARLSGTVVETMGAAGEAGADATEVGLGEDETTVARLPPEPRVWSKGEITALACNFEGDTGPRQARPTGDPVLRRVVANLGRRSMPPSGPIPERACSEGGDYVTYRTTAEPASVRGQPEVGPKVLVQGSEEPTALLPGRRRTWVWKSVAVMKPVVLVLAGVAAGVVGSRWIPSSGSASAKSGVLAVPSSSSLGPGPLLEPPPGSLFLSGVERAIPIASGSADPATSGRPSSAASSQRRAGRSPPASTHPTSRVAEATGRKAAGNAETDDPMVPEGF